MPRTTLSLFLTAVIALGAGAAGAWLTRSSSGVAVVDLDRIAKELGRDVQMANDLKANQTFLANELSGIQSTANAELKKMETDLGPDAATEEKQKLLQVAQAGQIQFNNLQKQADVKLGQRRNFLISSFREEARPIADRIAKARGAKAVVTPNEVFSFDNTIDITTEVIAEMRLASPPQAAPAAPAPAAAPTVDKQVRQASASTTKPAPKTKPLARKKDE